MEEDSFIMTNFNSICRLCLNKNGLMSPIFDNVTDADTGVTLVTKISDFIELQIHHNDGLPDRICHRCLFKTEKCARFRTQCAANDARLRRLTHLMFMQNPNSSDYPYVNSDKSKPKYLEDREVLVVDPSIDYDSSDQSENEQTDHQEQNEEQNQIEEPINEPYFKNVFMCQYCDQAFVDEPTCQEHELANHDPDEPFNCTLCDGTFPERVTFVQHVKSQHGNDKPYHCTQCDKGFGRRSDLRKHSIVHTGIRPFQCHFCLKSFSRNTNLSKHLRIHSGQKPHVCPQCPRSFISKGDLSRHILVHSGHKPFACQKCPLTFGRRDKLIKHQAKHGHSSHFNSNDNEHDEIDHNGLDNMVINLDPYQKIHESEMNHDMSDPKPDYDLPRVPDHIAGDASFAMEVSEKTNRRLVEPLHITGDMYLNGNVNANVKQTIVSNRPSTRPQRPPKSRLTKNIKCHQCPKRFNSLDAYKTHVSLHMGMRNFACKVCPKRFPRKRELERHAAIHADFKPFACSYCDKRFARKDKLVRHEKIHDEKVSDLPCVECGATFDKKDELVAHLKSHFADSVEDTYDEDEMEHLQYDYGGQEANSETET